MMLEQEKDVYGSVDAMEHRRISRADARKISPFLNGSLK